MEEQASSPARRWRPRWLVPTTSFILGLLCGVASDRLYMKSDTRSEVRPVSVPDARLLGEWSTEDGRVIRFYADGQYESVAIMRIGEHVDHTPYTSRYSMGEQNAIALFDPLVGEWIRGTLIFEGDRLSVTGNGGTVLRLTRWKG